MTLLVLASTSWIASDALSPALAPLAVALANGTLPRFGRAVKPAPSVPINSGVSTIHSAVAWVDVYGTVCSNDAPVLRFFMVMVQTFGAASETSTCMRSPGRTAMSMVMAGAGMISHQAE